MQIAEFFLLFSRWISWWMLGNQPGRGRTGQGSTNGSCVPTEWPQNPGTREAEMKFESSFSWNPKQRYTVLTLKVWNFDGLTFPSANLHLLTGARVQSWRNLTICKVWTEISLQRKRRTSCRRKGKKLSGDSCFTKKSKTFLHVKESARDQKLFLVSGLGKSNSENTKIEKAYLGSGAQEDDFIDL